MRLRGEVQNDQLDALIESWHAGLVGEDMALHECLGFTWDEYQVWVTNPSALNSILQARRELCTAVQAPSSTESG